LDGGNVTDLGTIGAGKLNFKDGGLSGMVGLVGVVVLKDGVEGPVA
jgi:hypothetical protein